MKFTNVFGLRNWALLGLVSIATALVVTPASAAVDPEVAFIFNTVLFLLGGFLVFFMAAGFTLLECGLVRSKNVAMQSVKNITLFSVACVTYALWGYDFMYGGSEGGFFGDINFFWTASDDLDTFNNGGYGAASDWYFQAMFVATAASIVSGTVAERVKLWSFLAFVVLLTGIIYPIFGKWTWGAGWLSSYGFLDFAGSTIVHSVGGWAALTGAVIIGPRLGKYAADGRVQPMPGSNLPLATLGTFILWLGWFGFNGGSQLALGTAADAAAIGQIFINTNIAAGGGVVAAIILTQILYGKVDLTMVLNGALAGLVSITAEPLAPTMTQAMIIGAIGGVIVVFAVPLLDKLKVDDVVGAVSVHLVAGIWGTIIVPFTNSDANYGAQIVGILACAALVVPVSALFWYIIKLLIGVRVSEEEEEKGLDLAELGMEGYPEFSKGGLN